MLLGLFDPEPFEAPYESVNRPLPALPEAAGVLWPIAMLGVLTGLVAAVWRCGCASATRAGSSGSR